MGILNTIGLWDYLFSPPLHIYIKQTLGKKKKKTIRIWKHKRSFLKCSTVFHFNDIQKYSECITADQCRKDVWNATENRTYLYARCTNMLKYVVKYAVGVK